MPTGPDSPEAAAPATAPRWRKRAAVVALTVAFAAAVVPMAAALWSFVRTLGAGGLQQAAQTSVQASGLPVVMRTPGGTRLHVFNTHLSLPTPFAREFWSERRRMGWGPNQLHEARTLSAFVRRHSSGEPFVVCGDFNSAPGSPVWRYLVEETGFKSAQAQLGALDLNDPRAFSTAGFMRLRMHLDHVFFGNGVRWVDLDGTCRFGDRQGLFAGLSDHVPIIGRFRCA